jgi:hypothetical protein
MIMNSHNRQLAASTIPHEAPEVHLTFPRISPSLQVFGGGKHVDYILTKWYGVSPEGEVTMKYRDVALFFVVASLFLNFFPHLVGTASGGRTVILTFSHIPTEG